jgi:hypothetical protein
MTRSVYFEELLSHEIWGFSLSLAALVLLMIKIKSIHKK